MIRPHAFVAMPFGVKSGADGVPVDFNRVYTEYVKPALDAAGLTAFRADEELRAGEIRTDLFQELLLADLVIADLTLDNPNVWYELGVRHALRARGVILVRGGRVPAAFDVYTDRKLRYSLSDGGPDPATLVADVRTLTAMIEATMRSWHGRKISPVYGLLPNLLEPDWRSLKIGAVREFWDRHGEWERRLELARRNGAIGDVLVLAEEGPVAAFRAAGWIEAGAALRKAERFRFALEHLDRALEIEPDNLRGVREKGTCLQRLALQGESGFSLDRAREHLREALQRHPADVQIRALLGRVEKDAWTTRWRSAGRTPEQLREEAAHEAPLLRVAIDSYTRAYRAAPAHYHSGINALTLMHLHEHLVADGRYGAQAAVMAGAVRFAAECGIENADPYYALVTLGDLEVLVGSAATVRAAYAEAIAKNARDGFALRSSRAQLSMLAELGFRPEVVAAGIAAFDRGLARIERPEDRWQPRQVLLFSGHMLDAPDRKEPRFPPAKEAAAAAKIAEALDALQAGEEDLAYSQSAAGGDLLFIEACQQRGVRVQILLPLAEPDFIETSVLRSSNGADWRRRYFATKVRLMLPARIMPDELGRPPPDVDPFERCNLWLLYSALARGTDKVRFVTLWNGGGGDGPGGTAHMYNEVKRRTGRVTWIDTRLL